MNLQAKYYEDQYLKHHGIKGQKWGRRRFQNEDGSLTPAGQKRYNDSSAIEVDKDDYSVGDVGGRTHKNRDPGNKDDQSAKGFGGKSKRNQEIDTSSESQSAKGIGNKTIGNGERKPSEKRVREPGKNA